jgi:hypothetical protein
MLDLDPVLVTADRYTENNSGIIFPVLRIRYVNPGSRIQFLPIRIPDPRVKKAPDPGSRIRGSKRHQITDPGVKKAPDPGSGPATLPFPIPGQEPAVPDDVGMFVALPEQLHLPVRNGEAGGQHPLHSHVPVVKFTLNICHQIINHHHIL